MTVSPDRVQELLEPYYHQAPLCECIKIIEYIDLLKFWNRKVSLTAISHDEEIVRFHFGESILALSMQNLERGRLADVGSGAGFPGLAMKLFRPKLILILIEPNKKKCAFLNETARKLGMTGVEVLPMGFELSDIESKTLDFITSRALGKIDRLLKWSQIKLARDGQVLLWLGAADAIQVGENPRWKWIQTINIPGSVRRKILMGIPQAQ